MSIINRLRADRVRARLLTAAAAACRPPRTRPCPSFAPQVRVYLPNAMLPVDNYVRALAETRIWFATSERGDHVSTTRLRVLASGRAMLLCALKALPEHATPCAKGVRTRSTNLLRVDARRSRCDTVQPL